MEHPVQTIWTLIFITITYFLILRPFILSPLRMIPGPPLYKITKLLAYNDQRVESRNVKLNEWHTKYGPVIQVGPNEISLSSLDHLKRVYIKQNLPKSSFYAQFNNFDELNAFSILDRRDHITRKKLMTKIYTKTNIFQQDSQRHINTKVGNLLQFTEQTLGNSIDVYEMFNSLAMDVVTYYEVGSKFSTNLLLDLKQRKVIKAFRASSSMWFWTTLVPSLWSWIADDTTTRLSNECREWSKAKFLEAYEDLEQNGDTMEMSLVRQLWSIGMSKWAIGSEVFDHVAAGHETTGTSLAFCTWQLSRPINKHIQDKIYNELCDHFGSTPLSYLPLDEVDKLPYVDAVISETTRLHAAIPGSEPRIVDSKDGYSVTLPNGTSVNLPQGTIVSVQPWSIHNDPSIFVHPEQFHPERWLKQEDETDDDFKTRLKIMRSAMFAFGAGNRMCLGMNVAITEMKLCIAQLYWRYNSHVSSDWCNRLSDEPAMMGTHGIDMKNKHNLTDVQLMSMADSYTSRPLFDECWLTWEER
ncbi:Isotrichodermin C-15 hydroxylase [Cyberlindnera fabianii]|uniref:Isotrichodermin C-15 hydroxylase n=1 Tax=Cyberlindnera fabianii TaxID=36022 RepID=A0A1V2L4D4_CYBFA|nr:Isotrichodermin C-15 hydroxylase [Cyberlindnera fabianii]